MNWLIGIAVVMLLAHLYFRHGRKRLQRDRKANGDDTPPQR